MSSQPNLVFLLPDQLRYDFLSCYGASFIDTPHIDALAAEGVRYERAYSAHPVCVPARVSLISGLHASHTGVLDNGQFLRPDYAACGLQTWSEILNAAGYYTAAVGKMHFYPWDLRLGFQYRVIAEDKRWLHIRDDYYHFLHARGLRRYHGNEHAGYHENKGAIINRLPWECSVDHFVGQEACRFIREHGTDGPFALMVGFPGPHCPYDPTPEYATFDPADMPPAVPEVPGDTPKLREQTIAGNRGPWNGVDYSEFTDAHKAKIRAHCAGLVKAIDDEVGAIVAALREQGLWENTIIVLASDHGDYLGDHNLIGKGHFFEASCHVPMIVRLPGQAATARNELVELTDVTATLLALAGCEVPAYMDSIPLPGLGVAAPQRECIVGQLAGGWSLYDGAWRLSKYATGEVTLFHLEEDPHEQHNRIHDPGCRERLAAMDAALTRTIMQAMQEAFFDRRVYIRDLSQDPWFGREGWVRPFPRRVQDR
ncbi:MAG TPA: sulfatase-like hydrolase/transferase [Chloroflexi bacterium]|nr:sulfatase-like hydrolase/transferase [Chloroflexota bacterium]